MKKKFLSLMMAAAVVATTSVSAFAEDRVLSSEGNVDVTITGKVIDDQGREPAGTFKVSVPTAATFMVTKDSVLEGTTINVKNDGDQKIDVYAEQFKDLTKENEAGITVVPESNLTDKKRTYVSLSLRGKDGNVYLKTEDGNGNGKGLYKNMALDEVASKPKDLKLTSVAPGHTEGLKLQGKAGAKNKVTASEESGVEVGEAVSDNFTLTLKIKKSTNSQE